MLTIRAATPDDEDVMWRLFHAVLARGDAFPFDATFDRETFRAHWFGAQRACVADSGRGIAGMYKAGANYPDRGAHIASATYAVDPCRQGQGVGRALVEHSLAWAKAEGFLAMQFNFVVSTNQAAIALYTRLGFTIVGTLPQAFRHAQQGLVDAHVMFRRL